MKAVILAGGEGSRLRPLTLGRPKPMTPLLGKPVLGHILDLLRRHGITEIAVTLRCLPGAVMDWFGDGEEYGVSLRYFIEEEALGTAGGVKRCAAFLGDEDFLVVSGDAVCDLDLTQFAARHSASRAQASLALCRCRDALEYGLVRTADDGRVLGFVEKPDWSEVDTQLVNTGVYLLSPAVLDAVPEGESRDFGRDVFPSLLARGVSVYGWEVPGYWKDMGDCKAYLACCMDALDERVRLDRDTLRGGAAPEGVEVRGPCWIGSQVSLAPGCRIGPFAVLSDGSSVETGAVVERSVLLGACVGEGAEVTGAILCAGVCVHRRAMVGLGAVLGEGVRVGAEAIVAPGVKLWPGQRVEDGARATVSRGEMGSPAQLRFSASALLRGSPGEELSAGAMLALGSLLGEGGAVGVGWSDSAAAGLLGRSLSCGVAAAGGSALVHDAPCPSAAAWLGRHAGLPASVFVWQDGDRAQVRLTGPDGLPLSRGRLRKLEGAFARGEAAGGGRIGRFETIAGVGGGYTGAAGAVTRLRELPLRPVEAAVPRGSGENELLARALAGLGVDVRREEGRGRPTLSADWGGCRLTAWDEEGRRVPPERILVLLVLIEYENGSRRAALPGWAPAAADSVAEAFGGRLLRLGRDEEAPALWRAQPWFWDGIFAACRLCARLGLTGESLAQLDAAAPRFAVARAEVPLRQGRGRAMERLHWTAGSYRSAGEGWVWVVPSSRREAMRVIAEAGSMEAAQELCAIYERKIRRADGD